MHGLERLVLHFPLDAGKIDDGLAAAELVGLDRSRVASVPAGQHSDGLPPVPEGGADMATQESGATDDRNLSHGSII